MQKHPMWNRALRTLALGTATTIVLAACGSSSNSASSNTASSNTGSQSTPASTAPSTSTASGSAAGQKGPIVIGMITSLSGDYSALGQFDQKTIQLLSSKLNAAGGIDGRKVKVVYEDDQTNPTQAVVALNKLIPQKPTAIIGPVLSPGCAAVEGKVETLKVPMVTLCAYDGQAQPVNPYDFMATLSTHAMTGVLGDYLRSKHLTRVALLYDSSSFGQSGLAALTQEHTVNLATKISYNLTATTFTTQLQQALSSNPQAVIVWGAGPPLVTIAKEYQQLGAKAPLVMSGAAATPLFVGPVGSAGNGVVMASSAANVYQAAPKSNPSAKLDATLASEYQAKYHQPMSQFTADACGAWNVIVDAIKKAGSDPTAVRDAMEKDPAVGCHGTYKYSPTDHFGIAASDIWVVTDTNGKLVPTPFSLEAAKSKG